MSESSITAPQTGHTEPDPQSDPQPETQTEPQMAEPVLPQEQVPAMTSTSPDQAQFAKMSIDDGMESGESSYRTTMPAPEAITFHSTDVLDQTHDDEETIIMINPCKKWTHYSSWLKENFHHLVKKKDMDFVDNTLELSCRDDLLKYSYYEPRQWVDLIGKLRFLKNYKFIIELNLIWTATIHTDDPVAWDDYHEIRDDNCASLTTSYKKEYDRLMEGDIMACPADRVAPPPVRVPVVPVKTPDVVQVKTPIFSP